MTLPALLPRFRQGLLGALALRRQRRRLARLDDHILCDIGLTRAQATAEAGRATWDVPGHWRA